MNLQEPIIYEPLKGYRYEITNYNSGQDKCGLAFIFNNTVVHRDKYNLYWKTGRDAFIKNCNEGNRALIHEHLLQLPVFLSKTTETPHERVSQEPEDFIDEDLSESEKSDIRAFLENPNMVDEIVKDFELMGHVGENHNKILAYLVSISRISKNPLGLIVQGASGAGKSNLVERILELSPPESTWFQSRLTKQALWYLGPYEIKNKLVIIAEREGSVESDYSIRTLISEKRLHLANPIKNEKTGEHRTDSKEVHGPIAYIETTTRMKLNPENTSRCFVIHPDTTSAQTRVIHRQIISKYSGNEPSESEKKRIQRKHQNAQRLIQPCNVIIPFAEYIQFPYDNAKYRRAFQRFMVLIEVIALLHQYQREYYKKSDEIFIKATIHDYKIAYELASSLLGIDSIELGPREKELLAHCRDLTENHLSNNFEALTVAILQKVTGWSRSTLVRSIETLVDLGFLSCGPKRVGSTAYYRLDCKKTNPNIPTPEEVELAWKEAPKGG